MSVYDEDGKRLEVRAFADFDPRVTVLPSKCSLAPLQSKNRRLCSFFPVSTVSRGLISTGPLPLACPRMSPQS